MGTTRSSKHPDITDAEAKGTLAAASGKNVEALLGRASKRRRKANADNSLPDNSGVLQQLGLPSPRRGPPSATPICGAPATATATSTPPSTASDAVGQPSPRKNPAQRDVVHGASSEAHEEHLWEDVSDAEEQSYPPICETAATFEDEKRNGDGLTIALEGSNGRQKQPRRTFTKEDREVARLVHRAHLLCLLGRGLLYDEAANDPLLQATLLSLIPRDLAASLFQTDTPTEEQAAEASTYACSPRSLQAIQTWFRGEFKLAKHSGMQKPAQGEDDIDAAIRRAQGIASIVDQLHHVIEKRCGDAQELSTLFAAAVRASGYMTRTIHLFEPSSLKPGDALKQQERALAEFMKRPAARHQDRLLTLDGGHHRQGRGDISGAARAATSLLTGEATNQREDLRRALAQQLGLEDERAIRIVPGKGGGAGPSIQLDASKLKRGKKRGGRQKEQRPIGTKNEKAGNTATFVSHTSPSDNDANAKKRVPRRKRTTAAAIDLTGEDEEEVPKNGDAVTMHHASPTYRAQTMRRSKIGRSKEEAALAGRHTEGPDVHDEDEELADGKTPHRSPRDPCEDGSAVLLQDVTAKATPKSAAAAPTRKRKSDEEFERDMAIAMAATAFETAPKSEGKEAHAKSLNGTLASDGDPSERAGKGGITKKRSAPKQRRVPGAAFGAHQRDVGKFWLEVYCSSPSDSRGKISTAVVNGKERKSLDASVADGRWIYVDAITGWFDCPERVEGLAPRGQPIAYVVAFLGGGAKDVTRRYTSSFIAAGKQRDEEWWEQTLRPLRSRELAAMGAVRPDESASWAIDAAQAAGLRLPGRAAMVQHAEQTQCEAGPSGAISLSLSSHAQGSRPGNKGIRGGGGGETNTDANAVTARLIAAREERELEARVAVERRGLPTTIEGFKTHATLVLFRHIGKYESLKPGSKPVGTHRGEAYYLREDVGHIHTTERWKRLGREVLPEELDRPAKRIKKRGAGEANGIQGGRAPSNSSSGAASTHDGDAATRNEEGSPEMSDFYGHWQTREWAPPAAANGRVPKNERGNVEAPPFASALPAGTAHVRLPGVAAVCRKLGIDFAPALVGFEIRGGRSVPSLDGVVVCVEHEAAVRAAYDEDMRLKAERAKQKRLAEAEVNWRQLLRALVTRVRLQEAYGGHADAEAAAHLLVGQQAGGGAGKMREGRRVGKGSERKDAGGLNREGEDGVAGELADDVDVEEI